MKDNQRAQIFKREADLSLFAPKWEEEILRRVAEENEGPIYDSSMREIFELMTHRIRDSNVQRKEPLT